MTETPQASAQSLVQSLDRFRDGVISQATELAELRKLVPTLEDRIIALSHKYNDLVAQNRRLATDNAQLRRWVADDAETIKSLTAQISDGERAHALVETLKREIGEYDLGNDPRDRVHLPNPDELFDRFLEIGDLIGLNREKLLESLTPVEAVEPEAPEAPPKRNPFSRLFRRNREDGSYVNEMARQESRPKMMQSVADDIASSPLAAGVKR